MSLVIIVPKAEREAVRAALELAGYGHNNCSVPMRGPVPVDEEHATHYGTHWWAGAEFDSVVEIIKQTAPNAAMFDIAAFRVYTEKVTAQHR